MSHQSRTVVFSAAFIIAWAPVQRLAADTGLDNPVTILTQLLIKSPETAGKGPPSLEDSRSPLPEGTAGQAMAERFAEYVEKGGGGRFIAQAVRDQPEAMAGIMAEPGAWVKSRVAHNQAAAVAELYFVMGAGTLSPDWAAEKPELVKSLTARGTVRGPLFDAAMEPWTAQQAKADGAPWVSRFLDYAAGQAHSLLLDSRVKKEIAGSIIKPEETPVAPGSAGQGGEAMKGSAKGFAFESLYVGGAKVERHVFKEGDPVSRAVSIKIYTVKEGGRLVNKIGIFDITNKGDIFGRKFDILTKPGVDTFVLDDRVPGMPKYALKFVPQAGGDTKVCFGREGNDEQVKTSLSELFGVRARQALDEGGSLEIGGKSFQVLGQGGAKGSLLFFPGDLRERMADGADLTPELAAEVNQRSSDGRNVLLPGKRDLGCVDAKPYHVEFNKELGIWEVKEGGGDPDQTQGRRPGQTSGDTPGEDQADSDLSAESAPFEKALVASGEFERNDRVRKSLRRDLRDKVRVYSWCKRENGEPVPRPFAARHVWFFPAEQYAPRNLRVPVPGLDADEREDQAGKPDEIRGIVHYIAASRASRTMYFDLDKPRKVEVVNGEPQNHPFAQAGYAAEGSLSIADELLLSDAMERAGYDAPARKAAARNLARLIRDKGRDPEFSITASAADANRRVKARLVGGDFYFWPEIEPLGSGGVRRDKPGPGRAFDLSVDPGGDEGFPAEPQVRAEGGVTDALVAVKQAADGSAALFANDRDEALATRWYLMYKFFADDGQGGGQGPAVAGGQPFSFPGRGGRHILRSSFVLVFAKNRKEGPPFPGPVKIGGLKAKAFPQNGEFRYLAGSDNNIGLWYAVKNKQIASSQQAVDMPANCLGPVIWWGMEFAQAKKACAQNRL